MSISSGKDLERDLIANKLRQVVADKCHRVLLINPPQISANKFDIHMARSKRYFSYPPYGIGLLYKVLLNKGYEARIIDLNYCLLSAVNSTREQLNPDIWEKYLKDTLGFFNPDIAGISCMFTMYYNKIKEIAACIKDYNSSIGVIAGGVCVTNSPEHCLRGSKNIDFLSLYEADTSFVKMLDYINGKTSVRELEHLATLINGNYVSLPERIVPDKAIIDAGPDYGDMDISKYSSIGECGAYRFWLPENTKVATVLSGRGCRGNCRFCSVRNFYGKGVRSRSIECVVDEIESLTEKYDINHISWLDDDLLFNKERSIRLFKEITKRRLNITWDASNGVIASSLDLEIMGYAAESGCVGMHFGLESGSAEILKKSRKPSRLEHYKQVAKIMKVFPQVFTKGFLIIGFPGETIGQMLETIAMALDVSLDWYSIQILSFLPATDLHREMPGAANKNKEEFDPDAYHYGTSQMGTQRIIEEQGKTTAQELVDYFKFPQDYRPIKNQLSDIWFLMDYKINYERILSEENPVKLKKYRMILYDVCNRMTKENPLSSFFMGVVERKLGNQEESLKFMSLSQKYLANQMLWQKRFSGLGLGGLYLEKNMDINHNQDSKPGVKSL